MKRILFFATPADITPVLLRLEANAPLKFVEMGTLTHPDRAIHLHASQVPNLGIATHETGSRSQGFMVSHRDTKNHMSTSITKKGEKRWNLFNADNEETVVMATGGKWKDMLLPGEIGTLHQTPVAQQLMKWFLAALKAEGFIKIDMYWIGKEALGMLKAGKRLSKTAEQSPPEFDLKPPA